MSAFSVASLLGYLAVVGITARNRGRTFATFIAVILGIFTLNAIEMQPWLTRFVGVPWLVPYLQAAVYVHFLAYQRPRMRSLAWRALISVPASFHAAGTLLAWPWAIASAVGFPLPLPFLPYAFALLGVLESFVTLESVRNVVLDAVDAGALRRYPLARREGAGPALSLVQITDPHLGPFMSVTRLARICQRAVERNPDLIFLTGDLLTIDSNRDRDALQRALAPLAAARGKVFACLGNHDHEAPEIVRSALAAHGVRLLVDEACMIDTPLGRVQIVGLDFQFRGRKAQMAEVFAKNPRPPGNECALRIVLLHDPGAFARVPEGEGDLVLSGHTHGGQVGLVTFGLPWTFVSIVTKMPDHGLWARGRDRLYVHRGTGHYGFPLRVGVPAEQSLLRIQLAEPASGNVASTS